MDTISIPRWEDARAGGGSVTVERERTDDAMSMGRPLRPSRLLRWFLNDLPYLMMFLLALAGVALRLTVGYWIVLTPVFAVISIAEGWRHDANANARMALVCRLALTWCAFLLAIYLLYNGGVQGVLNANADSLVMLIVLALGTFVAGVEARVWRISAVGGVLFVAVPGLGWLDQSPLVVAAAMFAIVALGALAWWLIRARLSPIA